MVVIERAVGPFTVPLLPPLVGLSRFFQGRSLFGGGLVASNRLEGKPRQWWQAERPSRLDIP